MRQATLFPPENRSAHPGTSSGQSIVELALMLPVLALVLIGILDLGRIYFAYIAVINVSREGARYAAAHPPGDCGYHPDDPDIIAIQTRAREEADASRILPAQLTIVVSCYYPLGDSPSEQPIMVTAMYDFQMITTRIVGFGPIRLKSETTMQIFGR